jgi:hypothetical protein
VLLKSIAVCGWKAECVQDGGEWWSESGDTTEDGAIVEDEDQHRQAGELVEQGVAGRGEAGAVREQFEERKDQEGDHGAEDERLDALFFV